MSRLSSNMACAFAANAAVSVWRGGDRRQAPTARRATSGPANTGLAANRSWPAAIVAAPMPVVGTTPTRAARGTEKCRHHQGGEVKGFPRGARSGQRAVEVTVSVATTGPTLRAPQPAATRSSRTLKPRARPRGPLALLVRAGATFSHQSSPQGLIVFPARRRTIASLDGSQTSPEVIIVRWCGVSRRRPLLGCA